VNRPLPAFAALLALLALAMFAVSSSSRSTTIQPPRAQRKATQQKVLAGQSNFVFVVPAAEEATDHDEAALESALISVVCVAAPAFDYQFERATRAALLPARISIAECVPAIERQPAEVDCRSHYDPVYDRIVHGHAATDAQVSLSTVTNRSLSAVEVLSIFKELGAEGRTREVARWQPLSAVLMTRVENYVGAMYAWIRFSLNAWIQDFGLARHEIAIRQPALAWAEYAELMNEAVAGPTESQGALESIVRFSDRMWRSAALSWDRTLRAFLRDDREAGQELAASLE
jgi:hypothetical protein